MIRKRYINLSATSKKSLSSLIPLWAALSITSAVRRIFIPAAADQGEQSVGYISAHGQSVLHQGGKDYEIQELYVARISKGKGSENY